MTSLQKVQEMLMSPEGVERYLAWLRDDTTILMCMAARELARPRAVTGSDSALASSHSFELGASIRANEIVDFLTMLPSGRNTSSQSRVPVPTYGSADILAEETP